MRFWLNLSLFSLLIFSVSQTLAQVSSVDSIPLKSDVAPNNRVYIQDFNSVVGTLNNIYNEGGRVGIGTSAPAASSALHVKNGDFILEDGRSFMIRQIPNLLWTQKNPDGSIGRTCRTLINNNQDFVTQCQDAPGQPWSTIWNIRSDNTFRFSVPVTINSTLNVKEICDENGGNCLSSPILPNCADGEIMRQQGGVWGCAADGGGSGGGSLPTCGIGQILVSDGSGWVCADQPGPPPVAAGWVSGAWGSCSKTCGGGTQTRTVECKRNGKVVSASECKGAKPAADKACNAQACAAAKSCEIFKSPSYTIERIPGSGWARGGVGTMDYPKHAIFYSPDDATADRLCEQKGYKGANVDGGWTSTNYPTENGWAKYWNLSIFKNPSTRLCTSGKDCYNKQPAYIQNLECCRNGEARQIGPVAKTSGWFPASSSQSCEATCSQKGLKVGTDSAGKKCKSVESQYGGSTGGVTVIQPSWQNCNRGGCSTYTSPNFFCYKSGQKQDSDSTDRVTSCYCSQ